jgi:hypothetical protein
MVWLSLAGDDAEGTAPDPVSQRLELRALVEVRVENVAEQRASLPA